MCNCRLLHTSLFSCRSRLLGSLSVHIYVVCVSSFFSHSLQYTASVETNKEMSHGSLHLSRRQSSINYLKENQSVCGLLLIASWGAFYLLIVQNNDIQYNTTVKQRETIDYCISALVVVVVVVVLKHCW